MNNLILREWNNQKIRQREDNYVCLTDMCKACGKKFKDWNRLDSTKEYLEELSLELNNDRGLIEINQGGTPELQGTWGHPYVAVQLATWLDPKFSVFINRLVASMSVLDLYNFDKVASTDRSGFVYLVHQKLGNYHKIGISKEPYKRLQQLQTGNPTEMRVLKRVYSLDCLSLESKLHHYFEDYQVNGEWFSLPEEAVKRFEYIAITLDEYQENYEYKVSTFLPNEN